MRRAGPALMEQARALRWPLLWLVCAGLTAAAAWAVDARRGATERQLRQALDQLERIRAARADAQTESETFAALAARHRRFAEAGKLPPEDRQSWETILRRIRDERRLPGLTHAIAAPRPLAADAPGTHEFFASAVTLESPLRHENNLLDLLADLSAHSRALIDVRSCVLERVPGATEAALRARCALDLISWRERS